MATRIPVSNFPNNPQRKNVILGGRRYGLELEWNGTCGYWVATIFVDGERIYGRKPLLPNIHFAADIKCLPINFGSLLLVTKDTEVTGCDALPCGSQELIFFEKAELYAIYGSVDP